MRKSSYDRAPHFEPTIVFDRGLLCHSQVRVQVHVSGREIPRSVWQVFLQIVLRREIPERKGHWRLPLMPSLVLEPFDGPQQLHRLRARKVSVRERENYGLYRVRRGHVPVVFRQGLMLCVRHRSLPRRDSGEEQLQVGLREG